VFVLALCPAFTVCLIEWELEFALKKNDSHRSETSAAINIGFIVSMSALTVFGLYFANLFEVLGATICFVSMVVIIYFVNKNKTVNHYIIFASILLLVCLAVLFTFAAYVFFQNR
jgi:hypothetical protein